MRLLFLICFALGGITLAPGIFSPVLAETVTISKMTYKNNGAYDAFFFLRYNLDNGTKCAVYLDDNFDTGTNLYLWQKDEKVRIDLTLSTFKMWEGPKTCLIDGAIPDGIRVWGKIDIRGGEQVSCKKSIVLLKGKNGKMMDYRSGGTTMNNNRCKQSLSQ